MILFFVVLLNFFITIFINTPLEVVFCSAEVTADLFKPEL